MSRPPSRIANLLSFVTPLAGFLLLVLAVQPWGDYPVNDDWIYARIARRFAETGKFVFDYDTGAAFIGQGVLAAPVIRLLGFSHTHLRLLTIACGVVLLWLLWRLLGFAGVRPSLKAMALVTVVCNPLFAVLSMSFLTEIYGYGMALAAAVVWFAGRREETPEAEQAPLISWSAAVLAALAAGGSFWIRQYCVMCYAALVGATVIGAWRAGSRGRLRASLPRLAVSCLLLGAAIAGYFWFARFGVAAPLSDFHSRLARLGGFLNPGVPLIETGIVLTYMTAFLLPLLIVFPGRVFTLRTLPASAALFALGLAAALLLLSVPPSRNLHALFPFTSNIIYNAGLGAILLPDVALAPLRPQWPAAVWMVVQWVLLAANALWSHVILQSRRVFGKLKGGLRVELLCFAALFALASLTVTIVVDGLGAMDRYFLPEFLSLTLVAAIALSEAFEDAVPLRWIVLPFAAAVLPLAFFTTAGLHDFFRWNDIRWALYHEIRDRGIAASNIQGGYEVNGSTTYDLILQNAHATGCIGACTCTYGWYCLDDSYRIGMNVMGDYEAIDSRLPDYWLANGPPVVLSRRRAQ